MAELLSLLLASGFPNTDPLYAYLERVAVSGGGVGPPGPPGPSGSTLDYPSTANVAVSGQRVVQRSGSGVSVCDPFVPGQFGTAMGITLGAASAGSAVTLRSEGPMIDLGWSWTPGLPIFCGPSGLLTQTFDPAWSWSQVVAIALTSTEIFVRINDPIKLA